MTPTLRSRSIGGVLWSAAGSGARVLLQLLAQVLLARLLGPEQFGLFALAMVVIALGGLFAEAGLAYGLIQARSVSDDDVRFVFTWHLLLGGAVAAALAAGADAIAALMGEPRVAGVLRWLALGLLVNSLAAPAGCLLRRRLAFRWLNLASVASYAVGFVGVGVPLALAGAQAGALVAAYLVQSTVQLVLLYGHVRHPVGWLPWHAGARAQLAFGATVLATSSVNWFLAGVDRLVIGRLFSAAAAGLYANFHNLVNAPASMLLSMVQSVLYPAGAQVQDQRERLRTALLTMIAAVAALVAPAFAAIAAVPHTIALGLYGERWAGGAELLPALALAMPFAVLAGVTTPMLWNAGRTRTELALQLPISLAWVAACVALAATGSLAAVAWGLAAFTALRAALLVAATLRALALPARALAAPLAGGIVVTALTALAVRAADLAARALLAAPAAWLALDVVAGALALPLALRVGARWLAPELRRLLRELLARVPGSLGARLPRWLGVAT